MVVIVSLANLICLPPPVVKLLPTPVWAGNVWKGLSQSLSTAPALQSTQRGWLAEEQDVLALLAVPCECAWDKCVAES